MASNFFKGNILSYCVFYNIKFNPEVIYNKFLPFLRVLTHLVFKQVLDMVSMFQDHGIQTDLISDESSKFIR